MAAPQITYTVIDANGERGTTSINLPTGFTLSQFSEFGAAMATLIDAVLGGKVESADICFPVDITTLVSNTALSTSDVEEIASFSARSVLGFRANVNIPALDELIVASGSDDIDLSNVDVAAFVTAMETGIVTTGGTIRPCDVDESPIDVILYARERFRASGTRR